MELADETTDYACTPCRHTGHVCFEALWLAQAFGQAQQASAHLLPDGATLVSARQFHGCGRACNVLMTVRRDGVDVTAGMPDSCDEAATLEPAARVNARRAARAADLPHVELRHALR